jgi:HK97 family phage major capsid protein
MDEKMLEALTGKFKAVVDESLSADKLKGVVSPLIADEVKTIVARMKAEKALTGRDISGLSDEVKLAFAQDIKSIVRGQKAALLSEQDSSGGYLVPSDVYSGIMRIAATVGLVVNLSQRFPMSTDQLDVPRETGSFNEGGYLGQDTEGTESSVTFGDAKLIVKDWYTIFRVANSLLADANVDVANFLLAYIAESAANRIDKEGLVGTGIPFVGLLADSSVTTLTLASGKDTFIELDLDDCSEAISNVEESVLADACFIFHRTVWHSLRTKKDATGGGYHAAFANPVISQVREGGLKPAGYIWGYPVYTSRHLPSTATVSQASTKFGLFGSIRAGLFYGDKGQLSIAKSDSATVGSKNVFAANQVAIRGIHRHALAVGLPAGVCAIKTHA